MAAIIPDIACYFPHCQTENWSLLPSGAELIFLEHPGRQFSRDILHLFEVRRGSSGALAK